MTELSKPRPDDLPGSREQRVFIGGHYDMVPTLRAIARFVDEISLPEQPFYPVIPLDFKIAEKETMDRDIDILGRCAYAIFDLSDLGAQLVEMHYARENPTRIQSLLVYPVRERRNEPERGRRTVISFDMPHFGYTTFNELKGIVWRFLAKAPTERDLIPRVIYDPVLDREVRRIRVLTAKRQWERAKETVEKLLGTSRYRESLDLWLQSALIGCVRGDEKACGAALKRAEELCSNDGDKAEVMLFQAHIDIVQNQTDAGLWERVKERLTTADRLVRSGGALFGDGRILQLMGYALWKLNDLEGAAQQTRAALSDRDIPDPVTSIQALNGLGYYLGEMHAQVPDTVAGERYLDEALDLTEHLPDYHHVFERQSPAWLDTRAWLLYLKASSLVRAGDKTKACEVLTVAMPIFEKLRSVGYSDDYVRKHVQQAEELAKSLGLI